MKLIVGHSNMDLDCIGSIVLAKYLYPDHVPVKSHLVHPVARKLMNLYEDRLGFMSVADLKGQPVSRMVVVDTRSIERISEYLRWVPEVGAIDFEVFDHHPQDSKDIPGALIHEKPFGANTTQLGLELTRQGVFIEPEDATIALTGIYADTGNFSHTNVTAEDFEVASYLLSRGASLRLVKDFLVPLKDKQQIALFYEILQKLYKQTIRGHIVQSCYMELEEDSQGLGAVVEQVFNIIETDLLLGFFFFPSKGKLLVIGRNSKSRIYLNEIMSAFGGGGHAQAASATIKTPDGPRMIERIMKFLEDMLAPATCARHLMTTTVNTLQADWTLLEASLFLEKVGHTGAPVVDAEGRLVGFLTLRDIMKGRKGNQMHVAVSKFMSRSVVSAGPDASVREVDDLMFEHNIGHLPVVLDGRLAGLVTRADLLDFKRSDRRRREALLEESGLPIVEGGFA
ncbi:MAG: CBS domain-containing protein [Spirochaetes bacterium]|nr:CBS domain-containing protein [Spirochaetota bacterium]MBU0955800.1 CBS domain-containing protein [Spirochaetota bacterium]